MLCGVLLPVWLTGIAFVLWTLAAQKLRNHQLEAAEAIEPAQPQAGLRAAFPLARLGAPGLTLHYSVRLAMGEGVLFPGGRRWSRCARRGWPGSGKIELARQSWSAFPAEEVTASGMEGGSDPASIERGPVWLDRVTAADLMLIWPEEEGWPQYIGALVILDGKALFDADGEFLIEPVREAIDRRLHLVPRFRQVLYWPGTGLGWPVWADAQSFDITEHVDVHPVPPPGDERQLLVACEALRRRPLHRARPLWEMWLLTGLPDERVGLFIKMHHAIADGVAGVATLAAFVDAVPDPPEMSAPAWSPSPLPSTRELFRDNVRRRRREFDRALSAMAQPIATARRLRRSWPAAREMLLREGPSDQRQPQNRIGPPGSRSFAARSTWRRTSPTPTAPQ